MVADGLLGWPRSPCSGLDSFGLSQTDAYPHGRPRSSWSRSESPAYLQMNDTPSAISGTTLWWPSSWAQLALCLRCDMDDTRSERSSGALGPSLESSSFDHMH